MIGTITHIEVIVAWSVKPEIHDKPPRDTSFKSEL